MSKIVAFSNRCSRSASLWHKYGGNGVGQRIRAEVALPTQTRAYAALLIRIALTQAFGAGVDAVVMHGLDLMAARGCPTSALVLGFLRSRSTPYQKSEEVDHE